MLFRLITSLISGSGDSNTHWLPTEFLEHFITNIRIIKRNKIYFK